MKLRLLPSTFGNCGEMSEMQHFACLVIDGRVAIDAGSLAHGANSKERNEIRDIILTHAHLDHIAGLPLFLDDLFPILTEPLRVHATRPVIDALETHIFNWSVYPKFSELSNQFGRVIEYIEIKDGREFSLFDLTIEPISVNHQVPSSGFIVSRDRSRIAVTGDTAEMDGFWKRVNELPNLSALIIECAFPNGLDELATVSHHLTPDKLAAELVKFQRTGCPIYVFNIKPAYREEVIEQLMDLRISRLEILPVGSEIRL